MSSLTSVRIDDPKGSQSVWPQAPNPNRLILLLMLTDSVDRYGHGNIGNSVQCAASLLRNAQGASHLRVTDGNLGDVVAVYALVALWYGNR